MNKNLILAIVVGVLIVIAIVQTIQISSLSNKVSGNIVTGNVVSGKLDTTGWTENEIMNYEMHGTIPARIGSSQSNSLPTQVGGC